MGGQAASPSPLLLLSIQFTTNIKSSPLIIMSEMEKDIKQSEPSMGSYVDPDNIEAGKISPAISTDDDVTPRRGFFSKIANKLSCLPIEDRGIEPVKPENRDGKQSVIDGFTMWASANLTYAPLFSLFSLLLSLQ